MSETSGQGVPEKDKPRTVIVNVQNPDKRLLVYKEYEIQSNKNFSFIARKIELELESACLNKRRELIDAGI